LGQLRQAARFGLYRQPQGPPQASERRHTPRTHDPGKIEADLALTLTLAGDCLADIADQPRTVVSAARRRRSRGGEDQGSWRPTCDMTEAGFSPSQPVRRPPLVRTMANDATFCRRLVWGLLASTRSTQSGNDCRSSSTPAPSIRPFSPVRAPGRSDGTIGGPHDGAGMLGPVRQRNSRNARSTCSFLPNKTAGSTSVGLRPPSGKRARALWLEVELPTGRTTCTHRTRSAWLRLGRRPRG
jgi:hypothetical protein